MKRYILALGIILASCAPSFSQGLGNTVTKHFPGAPSGGCSRNQLGIDDSNGNSYTCPAGTWVLSGAGAGGGSGTVTSVATTAPITGGTITTTGTIACATCVTSAASLTNHAIVLGAGSQATSALGSLGTSTTVLHGAAAGAPTFGAVSLTADVTGNLPVTNLNSGTSASGTTFWRGDGTWATPSGSGFANPMTTLGDIIYGGASGTATRLAGPTTPNGVPQYLVDIPAAGAAVAQAWQLSGVPVDATNPGTLLVTDRANYLNWTSGTTLALPAVATTFASNFPFLLKNTSTTLTITPNSGASDLIDGAASGTVIPNFAAFVYQDSTTAPGHWFTVKYPTFAAFGSTCTNGLTWSTTTGIGCAASAPQVGPLTGDVTTSGAAATIAANAVTGAKMANNTVTATQLAAQYSKGSCTELWGGSGTSFALTSGDDAVSNNSCYNDSGATRTITAVKCLSDNTSNTTTVNPTFGASGTGTTILSGALTCGNSNAMSSTGTVSNASWTTGTGINPVMGGTLTGTHIAMLVDYTF